MPGVNPGTLSLPPPARISASRRELLKSKAKIDIFTFLQGRRARWPDLVPAVGR